MDNAVHSLIVSSSSLLGLPRLLFPSIVFCINSFEMVSFHETIASFSVLFTGLIVSFVTWSMVDHTYSFTL